MSGADVITYDLGKYKIHTYVAPEESFGDATHILETPNQLVLIDTQYSMPSASEFRAYAESLGKPIKNIIISHAHPDHYLGLAAFKGTQADVWATHGVRHAIKRNGHDALKVSMNLLGNNSAKEVIVPNKEINVKGIDVDGLILEFLEVEKAEARHQLLIHLPQFNILIVQDLVYNNYHAYLNPNLKSWIRCLEHLKVMYPNAQIILGGHGDPAGPEILDRMICYLEHALRQCRSCKDRCAHKDYFTDAFPDHKAPQIMDFYLDSMYPSK